MINVVETQGRVSLLHNNVLRDNVRNFGAFYQQLVNTPAAQSQLLAFDELFSFYYSLTFDCSSVNPYPNTKGGE